MQSLLSHVPLTERQDQDTQLTPLTRLKHVSRKARADNDAYNHICSTWEDLDDNEPLDGPATYNSVSQVMDARHNIWYYALIRNISQGWVTMPPETKFNVFCNQVLNVDRSVINQIDPRCNEKTPDIMLYSSRQRVVFIGDVAVSRTIHTVDQYKTDKYSKLINIVRKGRPDLEVKQHNFIVKEDTSNVSSLLNKFKGILNIIVRDYIPDEDIRMTESANMLIRHLEENCTDRVVYNKHKENGRNAKSMPINQVISDLMDEGLQHKTLGTYVPKRSEDEIIAMIKEKVDELGGASYYDTSRREISNAFDDILLGKDRDNDKEVKTPKSTLKVCDNSQDYNAKSGLELIREYVDELNKSDQTDIGDYILSLLPNTPQLNAMIKVRDNKLKRKDIKSHDDIVAARVGGAYQYIRTRKISNHITIHFENKINEGCKKKGRLNEKKAVTTLDNKIYSNHIEFINNSIKYYGSVSTKPPVVDDSWDYSNEYERENTVSERSAYDYVRSTNGVQLCHSMSGLYNRITHMSAHMGTYDNIYIPPNGSFIALMPRNHAPVTTKNCDMPFIFITRARVNKIITHTEYEHKLRAGDHIYYVSKLCRLNLKKIACWDNAGFRLIASGSYLLSMSNPLMSIKEKVIGLLTYLTLDVHQKVSEYLDLLKYIGFMPFSDLHRLSHLIKDKCDLIVKTKMDVWMLTRLKVFVLELMNLAKLNASKPKIMTNNGIPTKSSLGIAMELPSFCDPDIRHADPISYIEEMNVLNTSRPKHLYGSQFSDASAHSTAQWNLDYDDEVEKYKGWATNGHHASTYPFDAKFCFSSDAVHYATKALINHVTETEVTIANRIVNGQYGDFMHNNCSLRGCTKEVKDRSNQTDIHSTSITECFSRYEQDGFNDNKARVLSIGQEFIKSTDKMEFSMSEKDQRGSGRPIATPTLATKACLMLIEKPEAELGRYIPNNILVAGKDKLKEQHIAYTNCIAEGVRMKLKCVYQLTEDQSKYSENDNTRKYYPYIQTMSLIPTNIRKLQMLGLKKLEDRVHLIKRIPKSIEADTKLMFEKVDDIKHLGIRSRIGWPQGMLNNMSTSVHCASDYWITDAFKKVYPDRPIKTSGLVHSDDSWLTICCNDLETFKLFSLFRTVAKKLFCLKLNEKKLWGGKYLGELVSNYNLNGHVHMSTGKVICNGMSNLTYQNWAIDVSNQISTIQQAYRAGATIGNLIMLSTLLRQQIIGAYQVTGKHKELLHMLPVELGGYPSGSAFKLAVTGIHSHYADVHNIMTSNSVDSDDNARRAEVRAIMASTVNLSVTERTPSDVGTEDQHIDEDDYMGVEIPTKGELFKAIKHLMPRSKKMALAMKKINEVINKEEFVSNGLALIITKPKTLAESIGHYGETARSRQFELSAEKYTQSSRRLACSQALQSAGRVVKVNDSVSMTINQMLSLLLRTASTPANYALAVNSVESDDELVIACDTIIKTCTLEQYDTDKGKVINRMPAIENIYNTTSPLQDVLITIIDDNTGSNYSKDYLTSKTELSTLINDTQHIMNRFKNYFQYFPVKTACKLIMQGKMMAIKARSWIQPKLRSDSLAIFLEDLYGHTLNKRLNYTVTADRSYQKRVKVEEDTIHDIYSCLVLNEIFEDKMKMENYDSMPLSDVMNSIDPTYLKSNSKLKHAVCQHVLNNNKDYLIEHIKNEKFLYEWVQAQKMNKYGKYEGDWKVKFMHADIVCLVESNSGIVSLTVNKLNLQKLLRGMRLMVMKCFSKYSYEYDNAWWMSKVWASSGEALLFQDSYLCYFNNHDTLFKDYKTEKCVSVTINARLRMSYMQAFVEPRDFEYSDNFRVIKAVYMDPSGKHVASRVANIYQNLGIRSPKKITLYPSLIDGFNNSTLLNYNILDNLCLRQELTVPVDRARKMIEGNINLPMKMTLWKTFYYFYIFASKLDIPVEKFLEEELQSTEKEEVVIETVEGSFRNLAEIAQTCVESLESCALEYEISEIKSSKKVKKPKDIRSELCKHIYSSSRQTNHLDFIFGLLTDFNMTDWIDSLEYDQVKRLDESHGDFEYMEYEHELYIFMVAYGLDKASTWGKIMNSDMAKRNRDLNNVLALKNLITEFVVSVDENFMEEGLRPMPKTLQSRFEDDSSTDPDSYD